MGSYVSRSNAIHANGAQKPVEVLPASESWSTLDAFQATVKKSEHHELINRSKTQKSLLDAKSFRRDKLKKRTNTLGTIPSHSQSCSLVSKPNKRIAGVQTKPTSDASQDRSKCIADEMKDFGPQPLVESQSRLNIRRGTHFYEVRKAMVNRHKLNKLESLLSEDYMESSMSYRNDAKAVTRHLDYESNISDTADVISEKSVVCVPSSTSLHNVKATDATEISGYTSSNLEHDMGCFSVDPNPHASFSYTSEVNEQELKCRDAVAKLSPRHAELCAREEIDQLLQSWKSSGQLTALENHAQSIAPSGTTTLADLAESLTNKNIECFKVLGDNSLHNQLARAFCIYVWIAKNIRYDTQQWKRFIQSDSNTIDDTQAENVLETRMTVCAGYANLYNALAYRCDLKVDIIHGHVKVWKSLMEENTDIDISFKPSRKNAHTWNSVSVKQKLNYKLQIFISNKNLTLCHLYWHIII